MTAAEADVSRVSPWSRRVARSVYSLNTCEPEFARLATDGFWPTVAADFFELSYGYPYFIPSLWFDLSMMFFILIADSSNTLSIFLANI